MASNGHLTKAELAPIPGGFLCVEAAAAWNAPGGPASAGLRPGGPDSSYRPYDRQVYWRSYWCGLGKCYNAAVPGTSNHGLGRAVDIPKAWEQAWMREHGAKYGWAKTEAPDEPWHWTFIGGVGPFKPAFDVLKHGDKGKRVVHYTKRLAYIRDEHGGRYLSRWYWKYKSPVVTSVHRFQLHHGLTPDGEIGLRTGHKIDAVFHRQYHHRHGR